MVRHGVYQYNHSGGFNNSFSSTTGRFSYFLSRHMLLASILVFLLGISIRPVCHWLFFPAPARCPDIEFEPLPDVGPEVARGLLESGYYAAGNAWKLARVARLPYNLDASGAYDLAAPNPTPPPPPSQCGPVCGVEGWGTCQGGECLCPVFYSRSRECNVRGLAAPWLGMPCGLQAAGHRERPCPVG